MLSKTPKSKKLTKHEDIYVDQSMYCKRIGDRTLFAPYTPDGIRVIDTMYANCIIAGVGTIEKLTRHIQENPHLHKTLKDNLILNMRHFGKCNELCAADRVLLEKKLAQRSLEFLPD